MDSTHPSDRGAGRPSLSSRLSRVRNKMMHSLVGSMSFCFGLSQSSNTHGLFAMETAQPSVEQNSTITCPRCGHTATETMPTDACVGFYRCKGCGKVLGAQPRSLLRLLQLRVGPVPSNSNEQFVLYWIVGRTDFG